MSLPLRFRIAFAFFAVPLFWGVSWSFMKIGVQSIPPILLLGTYQLLAGLAHTALAVASGRPFPRGILGVQAVVTGLMMTGLSSALMFWGVQYVSSGLGSTLFATMPIFVAFMAVPLLGERLTPAKLLGVAVSFAGVALLMSDDLRAGSDMALLGQAAVLLAAVAWALPLVLIRKWLSDVDAIALSSVQMLAGSILLLPIGLAFEGLGRVNLTVPGLIALAYMAVFSGFLAAAMYYWLVRHLTATRLALTSFITPAVAVVSGLLMLREPVTLTLVTGLALVAAGIIIVSLWGQPPDEAGVAADHGEAPRGPDPGLSRRPRDQRQARAASRS